ncbi:sushi, von Willebrand factor type A, EGF and pentraxin domain-containing protein 1-like [Pecten maximus]|uniref:sushi, von Willebrand factor type A, EGF and pentraxin domain-containing protein 1-like n=1 Tax=Pecten maximus TaxID=6579 RepID=UPI0014585C6E|nr:sushi, von Willebrand factor type A, EGF and pentraxin domain-containing protein 1-like [Pecten maximus]
MVWRFFQSVNYVDVATYTDALAREVDNVMTKLRCSSLCVEYGCGCVSFTFDDVSGICHMFTKALVSGGGTSVGANKVTECSVPVVFANATLVNYTGCNATYECNFGYNATASGMLTCQSNETWIPSEFECVEIPCSAPPTLAKGISAVTSLQVGAVAVYTCIQGYINRGGHTNTLNCVVGGTWAGLIDMLFHISSADEVSDLFLENRPAEFNETLHESSGMDDGVFSLDSSLVCNRSYDRSAEPRPPIGRN